LVVHSISTHPPPLHVRGLLIFWDHQQQPATALLCSRVHGHLCQHGSGSGTCSRIEGHQQGGMAHDLNKLASFAYELQTAASPIISFKNTMMVLHNLFLNAQYGQYSEWNRH
jgi:hypothetical protein